MLTLTALVLSALHPATPVTTTALAQKIQIIKGKKGTGTVKAANVEAGSAKSDPSAATAAKEQDLNRKAADLDAKSKALDQREQAIAEKQAEREETEKKQAEQKAKQQKTIEKIGEQNQQMFQDAAGALAGD